MLGRLLGQLYELHRLSRNARRERHGEYTLLYTPQSIAACSFFRTIYLPEQTPREALACILAHESSHIAHGHSYERIVMELLKALLWWNPFVWITARKLTEAEEFEADRDVLAGGCPFNVYADTLFTQLFGCNPDIANGLRDSLTKKRLQMMTRQQTGRHSLLRLAATLPALLGLLCAFGFTTRTTVVAAAEIPPADTTPPSTSTDEPFLICEQMPTFQGGDLNHFRNWVQSQLKHPEMAIQDNTPARVVVGFTIETDGSLSSCQILLQPDQSLGQEVLRILGTSPKWQPGTQHGHTVRVRYTLPVDFGPHVSASENELAESEFPNEEMNQLAEWLQVQPAEQDKAGAYPAGTVAFTYTVEPDGALIPGKVLSTPDEALGKEVLNLLRLAPKQTPRLKNGHPVEDSYAIAFPYPPK